MLRLFRVRSWCLVTAVVLAVGTTTAAFDELLHAGASHDAPCVAPLDVAHDASSHRFQAPSSDASGKGHCVACHLARSPRIGAQPASVVCLAVEARAPRPIMTIGAARAAALANLPSRSPPPLS
ncbi:MAG: hypothetical protein ACRD26_19900 [Vicinamibacterales bacterium]